MRIPIKNYNYDETVSLTSTELLARSFSNLEKAWKHQEQLLEQQKKLNRAVFFLIEKEKSPSEKNIEPLKNRAQLRLLPASEEKRIVEFYPKNKYSPDLDLIPIQYLAETFQLKRSDNNTFLGRNYFYLLLKIEGVMHEQNCEIYPDFFAHGYFVWQTVIMPSGLLRKMQFCTPKGWNWLRDRFATDWAEYVI